MAQKFKNKVGQKKDVSSTGENAFYLKNKRARKIIRIAIIVLAVALFSFVLIVNTRFAQHRVTKHNHHKEHKHKKSK